MFLRSLAPFLKKIGLTVGFALALGACNPGGGGGSVTVMDGDSLGRRSRHCNVWARADDSVKTGSPMRNVYIEAIRDL